MKTLITFLVLLGVAAAGLSAADKFSRPNILFILADDYGIDGVSCYGSDSFKTPNLDALARTGVRFENCYSAPLCGPTRCLFNTGRYAFRTGGLSNQSWRNGQGPNSRDEFGIAKLLKQAGYATGHAGKWRQVGETPGDWGFDEYLTDPTAGGYYWQTSYTKNGQLVQTDKEIYYPDVMHEFALDFMKRHRNEPFFFYYATHLVHAPILRTPDTKTGTADRDLLYADNVAYLDKQVGDLVANLDRLGLREKTLIVFSGDNGTAGRSRTIGGRQVHGQKGTMMEGGARVPLIANWKGVAPEGRVLKDLVDFSDFYAAFADLAGAQLPPRVTIDGRSFAPQLRGQSGQPREWIYVQLRRNWYVREPGWKLNNLGELFNMSEAPFEEKLVSADSRDTAALAARKRLQSVLDQLNPAAGKTEPEGTGPAKAKKAGKAGKKKLQKARKQ